MGELPPLGRLAVILAGGKSSRFGGDKALAIYQGRSLLEVLAASLTQGGFTIILSGPKKKLANFSYPIVEDDHPSSGPLWALGSLWRQISGSHLLLAAVDMPFLAPAVRDELWREGVRHDITTLPCDSAPSPLPAVYSRQSQKFIDQLITQNRHDLRGLLAIPELDRFTIDPQKFFQLDPQGESLHNINTPADLYG